jgi:hypothetical protein
MEELLEKIPDEKRWGITAKVLWRLITSRGIKLFEILTSKEEEIIAPIMAWEKLAEMDFKIWIDSAKQMFPWMKETFSIPVEDAIGAANLVVVIPTLSCGPEHEIKVIEATPERAVVRTTKCVMWESYEGTEIDPTLPVTKCASFTQVWGEEGLKAINPKLIFKLVKSFGWGDPYCESVIEFKDK